MSTPNRAAKLVKAYKVLKKHYEAVATQVDRPLLEHLLYACCLENASFEKADEVYARLQQSYFDWNEIRVTTVAELTEVLAAHPEAGVAAARLKRSLQSVFDAHYSFDLEALKKQNIGKSVKRLEKYAGMTPFAVAYVTQHALGGHAIPVDQGTMGVLVAIGVVTEAEAAKHHVPGMERAVAKSKGIEFASLLHQLGAEYFLNYLAPKVKSILIEIDPESKDRLPKKPAKPDEVKPRPQPPKVHPLPAAKDNKEAAKSKRDEPRKAASAADEKKKPAGDAARSKREAAEKAEAAKRKSASKTLSKKKPR